MSSLVFSPPPCLSLHYSHPGFVKLQWPDALSLLMWRGAELQLLVHPTVNVDIKMEAGLSVPLSCDCLRTTKGKLRQAEMASLLWTCHLRCVSYGHVALKACPSLRVPHNKTPNALDRSTDDSTAAIEYSCDYMVSL